MANEDIKGELAALRAEVAALAAARQAQGEANTVPEPTPPEAGMTESEGRTPNEHERGFMGDVQELIELIEHEMRETPMVAGLAIFSLGVLVGRFLR